jgi:hypothetical protein
MVPRPRYETSLDECEELRRQIKTMVPQGELINALSDVDRLTVEMREMVPREMLVASEANCRSAVQRYTVAEAELDSAVKKCRELSDKCVSTSRNLEPVI